MANILHADFDAFYSSVEQLDDPNLRNKPVVVGGRSEDRGVVAAASYEARNFGIKSAMPMRTALRLCPGVIRVNPNFERYRYISRMMMDIFRDITPVVEALSIDEAYLDVTNLVMEGTSPHSIAVDLKQRIKQGIGLTISVGVSSSKSIAKIASNMNKPDGLTIVPHGTEQDFLIPLSVDILPGIGPKTAELLRRESITTVGELASNSEEWFDVRFGKNGQILRELALGEDNRPVVIERVRKSVSCEVTLNEDTGDVELLIDLVGRLSEKVSHDLFDRGISGRTIKLKLRLTDFNTFTRQKTLGLPIQHAEDIFRETQLLLLPELVNGRYFRLIGVSVGGLNSKAISDSYQLRLFN